MAPRSAQNGPRCRLRPVELLLVPGVARDLAQAGKSAMEPLLGRYRGLRDRARRQLRRMAPKLHSFPYGALARRGAGLFRSHRNPNPPVSLLSLSSQARIDAKRYEVRPPLTVSSTCVTYCNATMTNTKQPRLKNLGEVEQAVMDYVWSQHEVTAESCREALASSRPMKDSTIRTVMRRLEEKGYISHRVDGRTFIYRASAERQNVAVRAVKSIIDRFCGGSAEELVLGMVDNAVLDRKQLERLAHKIAESEGKAAVRGLPKTSRTKE